MGWCSATEIMDTALEAALELLVSAQPQLHPDDHAVDELLRPFVRRVAQELRDGDWDCIEESNYFDRFGPEMYGVLEDEFYRIQVENFRDRPEEFARWLDGWRKQGRWTP